MNQLNANFFAYLALFTWPIVVFACFRKMKPTMAAFAGIMGALMFLPMLRVDVPVLPPLTKESMASIAVLIAVYFKRRDRLRAARPLRNFDRLLILLVIGAAGTVMTNADQLVDGARVRWALTGHDFVSIAIRDALTLYLPFLLGRAVFRSAADLDDLVRALVIAGLVYVPLCLIEVRLSPQLHSWIYGYFPHSFAQTRRGDGFRPVVFMGHGLTVARFMLVVVLASAAAMKARSRKAWNIPAGVAFAVLVVTFLLCKSLGVVLLAVIALPLILYAKAQTQMRVAVATAVIVLVFPILRFQGVIPTEALVEYTAELSPLRAQSLEFRFDNEELLMERARQRPMFGWGGYARNRVINERTGVDESITDGEWVIVLGVRGVVGFIAVFGFYVFPILVAGRQLRWIRPPRERLLVGSLALILAMLSVDLIPNASMAFPQTFLSGALYGLAKGLALAGQLEQHRSRRGMEEARGELSRAESSPRR
jgi:hypothetical protein